MSHTQWWGLFAMMAALAGSVAACAAVGAYELITWLKAETKTKRSKTNGI